MREPDQGATEDDRWLVDRRFSPLAVLLHTAVLRVIESASLDRPVMGATLQLAKRCDRPPISYPKWSSG